MSTLDAPDHFASTTTWHARVRFVADLAPKGMGVFMAPDRAAELRMTDGLYRRAPFAIAGVAVGWTVLVLALWPQVHVAGLIIWTVLTGAALVMAALHWLHAARPMLRPGAAPSWEFGHVSWLWLLFLAFSSGIFLVYPSSSPPHQEALCLVLAIAGISAAVFSSSSVRALAACLGPTIGLVTVTMIVRGATEQAAAVALAGGISVLVTLGLFQLFSEAARRDVERG